MDQSSIAEKIRGRATSSRKFARYMVFVNISIVIAILGMFFLNPAQHSLNSNLDTRVQIDFLGLNYQKDQSLSLPKEDTSLSAEANEEIAKLQAQNKQLELAASERSYLMNIIGDTVLRFGSVLLAIYLIQILVNFTRYHFRLASHLEATADALELSDGELDSFEKHSSILDPNGIEFGANPNSPQEKVADIIRDAIAKLPGK